MGVPRDARIYVAGHRGLVGSAIMRALQQAGFSNILTRTSSQLDLRDRQKVFEFFQAERPEYVYLAAAKVGGIWANMTYPVDFIQDNLAIELNVISAAYATGVEKLLFLGSSCIYPRHAPQPIKEEYLLSGPLEPTNRPYALAKICGIELIDAYRRQYGARFISVMPTNLYGPWDNFDLDRSHVLPAMLRKFHLARLAASGDWDGIRQDQARFGPIPDQIRLALRIPSGQAGLPDGEPTVVLWGTGQPRREFLHVDDLAQACLFLMDHYDDSMPINVGTGQDISIQELAGLIKEIVGFSGPVIFDSTKPDGMPRKLLDVTRITALGWRPSIALRDGIELTYRWYLSQTRD